MHFNKQYLLFFSLALIYMLSPYISAAKNTNKFDFGIPSLTTVHIQSSNATPTLAKAGDVVTVSIVSSEDITPPTITIDGHSATVTIGADPSHWSGSYTMVGGDSQGAITFSVIGYTSVSTSDPPSGPTNSTTDGSFVNFDSVTPTLSPVHIHSNNTNPSYAKIGDIVTVSFTSSESIQTPSVTIDGNTASISGGPTVWTATYTMTGASPEGVITFSISFSDLAGNAGTAVTSPTDASSVTFYKTAPTLSPVHIQSNDVVITKAKIGDIITLSFTSNHNIAAPTVTIDGHAASNSGGPTAWTATYTMTSGDAGGAISFSISFTDLSGNIGTAVSTTTDASSVTFYLPPVLTIPADVSTNISVLPTLNWNSVGIATSYHLQIAQDAGFSVGLQNIDVSSPSHSYTFSTPLLYLQQYYWRVYATDGTFSTGYQTAFSFTTIPFPPPVLTYPANTLTGVSILPTFTWSWPGIGSPTYDLHITNGVQTIAILALATTSYSLKETDGILQNGGTYTWYVTANLSPFTSTSSTSSFKTTPGVTVFLSNPYNGATGVGTNPTPFSWYTGQATGNIQYRLQAYYKPGAIAPTAAEWTAAVPPANTFYDLYLGSNLSFNASTLPGGRQYWWRVIAYDYTNPLTPFVVSFSTVYKFTISGLAYAANPSYPLGGTLYTNQPTFYWWYGYDLTNVTFTIQISATSNVGPWNILVGDPGITNISTLFASLSGTLSAGTTYWWRIVTTYNNGIDAPTTANSAAYSFTTGGVGTVYTPFLSYPTGGTIIYTVSPSFYWYLGAYTSGITYTVRVSTGTGGAFDGHVIYTSSGFLDQFYFLSSLSLTPGITYYWKVDATNGVTTLHSSEGSFIISSSLSSGYPVASWPIGNPTVYTNNPTVYWYLNGSTSGLTKYRIAWSSAVVTPNSAWATISSPHYFETTDLTQTSYTITDPLLVYGSHWYWAVAAYNGSTWSTWSVGDFTIAGGSSAGVPVLVSPTGSTTISSLTPTLYWYFNGSTLGIQSYRIIYSRTSDFSGGSDGFGAYTTTIDLGNTNTYYSIVSNLVAGATYYWKVEADYGGSVYSSFSSTGVFVVSATASLVVPLAGSPANGVGITTSSPQLSWILPTKPTSAQTYELQYSTSPDLSNPITVKGITDPNRNISGLTANTYYWRVRSVDNNGTYSPYSNIESFSVNRATQVASPTSTLGIPTSYELNQNYPNPFNPTTRISYSLPLNSFVTIKIYDMLGREIKTLINSEMAAGKYSVEWKGDNDKGNPVATGVYIYRITADKFAAVKKMLLLK